MAAPDERRNTVPPATLPEPRTPVDDLHGPAWFSYTANGDQIVWSAQLRAMLGQQPKQNEVSRKVLARYVHRDDHAKALGAITQTWTSRIPQRTTVRLMRADGGWLLMEAELIEPDFYLGAAQEGGARFAAAVKERLVARG